MAAAGTSRGGDFHISMPQTGTAAATTSDAILESSTTPSHLRGTTPPARQHNKALLPLPTPMDKTLTSVANLAKLLPTGTALAFQAMSPSFTNRGACLPANRYLTAALIYVCVLSCAFFSFTDSFVGGDGKLYYGVATAKGFLVFNYARNDDDDDDAADAERRRRAFKDLRRLRIRWVDYVHAVFSVVVFLTVAFSDTAVQTCYFPVAGDNVKQMLTNLPLGAGFLSTMVFLVFPTTRKGIDYTGPSTNS
ncbi:hypothetical protein QOZ80_1AG0023940 [Eleusine coracana subsp. coracana]|nr:hypothetical protein QOZ80_1AG0023940 [Eleusine coracana subsp. coracana]